MYRKICMDCLHMVRTMLYEVTFPSLQYSSKPSSSYLTTFQTAAAAPKHTCSLHCGQQASTKLSRPQPQHKSPNRVLHFHVFHPLPLTQTKKAVPYRPL